MAKTIRPIRLCWDCHEQPAIKSQSVCRDCYNQRRRAWRLKRKLAAEARRLAERQRNLTT